MGRLAQQMIMETEEGFTIAEAALKPLADEERGQVGLEAGGSFTGSSLVPPALARTSYPSSSEEYAATSQGTVWTVECVCVSKSSCRIL